MYLILLYLSGQTQGNLHLSKCSANWVLLNHATLTTLLKLDLWYWSYCFDTGKKSAEKNSCRLIGKSLLLSWSFPISLQEFFSADFFPVSKQYDQCATTVKWNSHFCRSWCHFLKSKNVVLLLKMTEMISAFQRGTLQLCGTPKRSNIADLRGR